MTKDQKRAFTRIFFDAETIVSQGNNDCIVQLVDISLRGILIEMLPEQKLAGNTPVEVCIHLGGDLQICMTASIANTRDNRVGLACDFIDVESMTHLRRLVELNTGDTALLERELHLLT
ncbi:PilZ domain-containing protein [Pseudohongiella spirulinae]|uniref:Cyclic diguanosine monophosphate-binding protein n=1 Tax=Pseudohongiella spirulinae TaxID=1249552 RepID=A0A0S2KAM5_9GAMM|nr:PilZ domain-containing protein [Pseudohongiella spirulinae]ALO45387.1 Cyclic diguanosine monophosphate-binding protein [Pseudohongiella spirulinae]